MSLRAAQNLYPGINPHLNSFLQQPDGGWESFHSDFITFLRLHIDAHLPPGYRAIAEKSLQMGEITLFSPPSGSPPPDVRVIRRSQPDPGGTRTIASVVLTPTQPNEFLCLLESLGEEDYYMGVMVYQVGVQMTHFGKPVTRFELRSPANKPSHCYHAGYWNKRKETLQSGLTLVEIDLLHPTRPILPLLPSYPDRQANAFPYRVLVSQPRPNFEQGDVRSYGVGVLDSLLIIEVSLAESDSFMLDLGAIYNQLYDSLYLFHDVLDHHLPPVNFEAYPPADQALIRQHMAKIAND